MGNKILENTCYSQKQLQNINLQRSSPSKVNSFKKNQQQTSSCLSSKQQLPILSQCITDLLSAKKPFNKKFQNLNNPSIIRFKNLIYFGETNQKKTLPNGFGKLYLEDGSILFSSFLNGVPVQKFFYARPDGTYSQGILKEGQNITDCYYHQNQFQFNGCVKDNLFQGLGILNQKTYVLSGNFSSGTLKSGKLTWSQNDQDYVYIGQFNQKMEMHGLGMLIEPTGIYEGHFMNNMKQGEGKYKYKNYNTYSGMYRNNFKQGYGILKSRYGKTIYQGQWSKGFPKNQNNENLDKILSEKSLRQINSPLFEKKSSNTSAESQHPGKQKI